MVSNEAQVGNKNCISVEQKTLHKELYKEYKDRRQYKGSLWVTYLGTSALVWLLSLSDEFQRGHWEKRDKDLGPVMDKKGWKWVSRPLGPVIEGMKSPCQRNVRSFVPNVAVSIFFSSSNQTEGKMNVILIGLRECGFQNCFTCEPSVHWKIHLFFDGKILFGFIWWNSSLHQIWCQGRLINLITLQTRNLAHCGVNWSPWGPTDSWCQGQTSVLPVALPQMPLPCCQCCQRQKRNLTSGPALSGREPTQKGSILDSFSQSHAFAFMLLTLMLHHPTLKNHYKLLTIFK